jgi:hypothetical protein
MNEQSKPGFGFSQADDAIRDMVASVKPRPRLADVSHSDTTARADDIAREVGFTSREPARSVKRRKGPAEPMQQLAMRIPISVLERFARFADDEKVSYPKALALILEKIGR